MEGPEQGDSFWIDKLPEWCEMAGFPRAEPFTPDRWLEDGDTVTVGEQTLERCIHAPPTCHKRRRACFDGKAHLHQSTRVLMLPTISRLLCSVHVPHQEATLALSRAGMLFG